jgi:hypothetical protein
MPKRFYAAWVLVVIIAAVLPIAIPYFIWPPTDYKGPSLDGTVQPHLYGGYSLLASFVPSSVSVDPVPRTDIQNGKCIAGPAYRQQRDATASVVLRGAYGIPFGSIDATCRTQSGLSISTGGGLLLASLAWIVGMAFVSAPFIFVLERRSSRRRDPHALLNRPLPG